MPRAVRGERRGMARAVRATTGLALAGWLGGCSGGPLDPHGPIAAQQYTIMMNSLIIMLAIVIPTLIAAVAFAWWYRESNKRARYRPDFVYSGRIEIVVWSIPTLVILFLGGIIWIGSHELDPAEPIASQARPTEVQVVALPWKWLFILPDQNVASVNELVVPAGSPVHLAMTDASVLNTFWVPQLGGMIYTMNGMTTQMNLLADHPGTYMGRSAMFSGDGFSDMSFTVRAVPQGEFDQWVTGARGNGPTLDEAAYGELAKPGLTAKPFTYRGVAPGLFTAITNQHIPPAPGPANGPGGAVVPLTAAR
ncbi:MAG: ubiquinol oxidase subunit II [Acetobacteraceae bacterium]|nr:ubiquinol oxidase subunit II [Acetobacteraceae bacterium]